MIVQADPLVVEGGTILVCPFTSDLTDTGLFRPFVEPDDDNGLHLPSQIMTDKLTAARRNEFGPRVGILSERDLWRLELALATILGLRFTPTVANLPGANE